MPCLGALVDAKFLLQTRDGAFVRNGRCPSDPVRRHDQAAPRRRRLPRACNSYTHRCRPADILPRQPKRPARIPSPGRTTARGQARRGLRSTLNPRPTSNSRGALPHTPARSLAGPRHPAPLPRRRAVRALGYSLRMVMVTRTARRRAGVDGSLARVAGRDRSNAPLTTTGASSAR